MPLDMTGKNDDAIQLGQGSTPSSGTCDCNAKANSSGGRPQSAVALSCEATWNPVKKSTKAVGCVERSHVGADSRLPVTASDERQCNGVSRSWGIPLIFVVCALLMRSSTVGAWGRDCAWSTSGVTTIPSYVRCDLFAPYGFFCDDITGFIRQMQIPWNEEGGSSIRLGYPSSTTSNAIAGAVVYGMAQENGDPNTVANTVNNCATATMAFYSNYFFTGTRPLQLSDTDIVAVGTHETGHVLGLDHQATNGACGGNGDSTSRAVMNPTYGLTYMTHGIWLDDWTSLRSGTCPYVSAIPSGNIKVYQTSDGSSFSLYASWATGSNLTPAIAYGHRSFGGISVTVQAAVHPYYSNYVYAWMWDGANWSGGNILGSALAGPSATFGTPGGTNTFLLAFPALNAPSGGQVGNVMVARSTDGVTWTVAR